MLKRRLIGNSLSILITRLTQSVATFVLSAAIARQLGAYELGQYVLAFGYYFIFMSLASQGFKVLFTRELSRHPEQTPTYLVSGTLLQTGFSAIAIVALVALVFVLPYSPDTSLVCYIMGLAILPFSLSNITESIFQAQERMYLITLSTVPVYVARVVVMIWAMQQGYGVAELAMMTVLSEMLIVLIEWGLVLRTVRPCWQVDWTFVHTSLQSVRLFIAIEGVSVINARLQLLILSLVGGEVVVGLYGAIVQLLQPFDILSTSLTVGVFPSMTKTVALGIDKQRQLAEQIIELLLLVALPIIGGCVFFGEALLTLVYQQPDFSRATGPLIVVALGLIGSCFSRPLSYVLVANHFERVNMREVVVATLTSSLGGLLLVVPWGLMGAAMSVLLVRLAGCAQYLYATGVNLFSLRVGSVVQRPLLLSVPMLVLYGVLQQQVENIWLIVIISVGVYGGLLGGLLMVQLGGVRRVYERLAQGRSLRR